MASRSQALQYLRQAMASAEADFRDGQWEAIDHIVNQRGKVLCVQRTGWGKSMVYFVSAKLMRAQGAGVTLIRVRDKPCPSGRGRIARTPQASCSR